MPPVPPNRDPRQTAEPREQPSLEHGKAIRADAFDRFIEEQLQRVQLENRNSEYEIVCHVY